MDDELALHVITEDDTELYVKLTFSDNEPNDLSNPGCIWVYVFDSHMKEIDSGEVDYENENTKLVEMIDTALNFMNIKSKSIQTTKTLKLVHNN